MARIQALSLPDLLQKTFKKTLTALTPISGVMLKKYKMS